MGSREPRDFPQTQRGEVQPKMWGRRHRRFTADIWERRLNLNTPQSCD